MASNKPGVHVAKLALIIALLDVVSRVSAASSASAHDAHPAAPRVTAQASSDPAPRTPRRHSRPTPNPFPNYGPQLAESYTRSVSELDRTKEYSLGRRVRNTLSGSPHFTFYRCSARACRGAELGTGGWVSIGWFDASYRDPTALPARPPARPDGAAPAPPSGAVATTADETALSPAEFAEFKRRLTARLKASRPPPKPSPRAPPPKADSGSPAPAAPAAPAARANPRPGDGPQLTESEMNQIPDLESNKTSWDYNSVRKKRGMTHGGEIVTAYRCDDKDGCKSTPGGSPWKPIGWWMP
jgi:hypothetical protein